MALTARSQPGTSEARIPCPVCAHPIHPIAGRCKHCKSDLVKLREARGVRAPRIDPGTLGAVLVVAPVPFAPATVLDATPTPVPAAAMLEAAAERIEPMVPPRRSRWPLIVVILAAVAIVVCLALLLGDGKSARAGGQQRPAAGGMPAPDRMDTMPAPPVPTPMQPDRNPFGAAPSPDPTPDPDLQNPFDPPTAPPTPAPGQPPGAPVPAEAFVDSVIQHTCDRLRSCGLGSTVDMMCSAAGSLGVGDYYKDLARGGRCVYDEAAAATCLAAIDGFQCGAAGSGLDFDKLADTFQSIGSCTRALSCP